MSVDSIRELDVLKCVKENLNILKTNSVNINRGKYHHNTQYDQASSVCRYGILTLADLNKQGLRNDTASFLEIMDDSDSHANGKNSVSLSVVGLTDLYIGEPEYNPFSPYLVDFIISSDVKARRFSGNYGNEFLSFGSISNKDLRAIDIRLLKLIKLKEQGLEIPSSEILKKYNALIGIALEMKKQELDIPLREMSDTDGFVLDKEKLSLMRKLVIKE